MKRIILFLLSATIFQHCGLGSTQPDGLSDNDFFPLVAGNTWIYNSPTGDGYPVEYKVSGSINIDGRTYYQYGISGNDYQEPLRQDPAGRVIRWINNQDFIYFDFTLGDGATYPFNPYNESENNYYIVTVRKNVTVVTLAGVFGNCTDLFFNIPGAVDDEVGYIFAPDVGIVEIYGAWHYEFLKDYHLN
jgi:hypothetical protein